MNPAQRDLLTNLVGLRNKVEVTGLPFDSDCGICSNTSRYYHGSLSSDIALKAELKECFLRLGKHPTFPIPGYDSHKFAETLWVGEQRVLRMALLEEVIAYLTELKKAEPVPQILLLK